MYAPLDRSQLEPAQPSHEITLDDKWTLERGRAFMTGTQANIDALTRTVGFSYVKIPGPDGKLTQFAHASSIQIVTPQGLVVRAMVSGLDADTLQGLTAAPLRFDEKVTVFER